jgi:tape measure domain-containing protein
LERSEVKLVTIRTKVNAWATAQRLVTSETNSTKNTLSSIGSKLKTIAATYLGMQTMKLGIDSSDTITSAQNKLNNIEGGSPELTAQSMDKMYAAAQRSKSSYSGMMSNVAKSMTLAGDSFQGNVDNAIRFQEIMAKAYTVGGASQTEAATSMYQLIQALGSGVLQGDELRSVREGAPIAYKEIEKFAQGVFNTEESLKDLASQGLITSDIIVAAIMNSEDKINKSFDNTKTTFGQTWEMMKNTALKAFQPVVEQLNAFLNSDRGQAFVAGLTNAIVVLAKVLFINIGLPKKVSSLPKKVDSLP